MEKITLFEHKDAKIHISMVLYFNEDGQLVFDGYDIGAKVKDFWGDYDYEYSYTIEPEEANKLYKILNITPSNRKALLLKIKKRFGGNKAYSKFGSFMDKNDIKYESFTWT